MICVTYILLDALFIVPSASKTLAKRAYLCSSTHIRTMCIIINASIRFLFFFTIFILKTIYYTNYNSLHTNIILYSKYFNRKQKEERRGEKIFFCINRLQFLTEAEAPFIYLCVRVHTCTLLNTFVNKCSQQKTHHINITFFLCACDSESDSSPDTISLLILFKCPKQYFCRPY